MRILWVDDDHEDYQFPLAEMQKQGHEVHCVRTVRDSFEAIASDDYDVFIVDLKIPLGVGTNLEDTSHNGMHVIERLRELGKPDVICYSNFVSARSRDRLLKGVRVVSKAGYYSDLLRALDVASRSGGKRT